ncbi:MAG: hypothetical protein IJS65_06150 [Clostridia bacterium]|nr:hypothetical protein [Clostridia bacterium]
MDDFERIELIERRFRRRYRQKKILNLLISAVIAVLGVSSVVYIWNYDGDGLLTFRWLTVDGTVFTTGIALICIAVSIYDIIQYTEITDKSIYFMRLASAVAESLIMTVVLLSQLPVFPEHMHIFRYDMFNMHMLIPLLTVLSFVTNDSPIGKLTPRQKMHGTWFITIYTAVVLTLILTGYIPPDKIPYFFMDVVNMPLYMLAVSFLLIYGLSFLLSHLLSYLNGKLSWMWFKGVTNVEATDEKAE